MKHERRLRSARRLILLTFLGLVIALEIACGINNYQDRNAIMMPGLAAFLAAAFLTPALIGLPFGVWDGLLPWDPPGEKADVRKAILSFLRSLLYLVTTLIVHSTLAALILSVTGRNDMSDFPEALPGFTLISLGGRRHSFRRRERRYETDKMVRERHGAQTGTDAGRSGRSDR